MHYRNQRAATVGRLMLSRPRIAEWHKKMGVRAHLDPHITLAESEGVGTPTGSPPLVTTRHATKSYNIHESTTSSVSLINTLQITTQFIVVPHAQNALYFWQKVRAL